MPEHVVDLRLELLSPCFLGGAYQQPEFRIASVRGLWRYWYRALYGAGDETKPSTEERRLFGSAPGESEAATGNDYGRGVARLVATSGIPAPTGTPWRKGPPGAGSNYLMFSMGMNQRRYLDPPFSVDLRLRVNATPEEFDRSARSLAAALSFSGIGARARRMGGAVHLAAVRDTRACFHVQPARGPAELARRLKDLLAPALSLSGRRVANPPSYHVAAPGYFSAGVLNGTYPLTAWREAMDALGGAYANFRRERGAGDRKTDRAAFGLPIRLGVGRSPVEVKLPARGEEKGDRRGSPLFLTFERLADDKLAVVWSFFRSSLSPDGQIVVGNRMIPEPSLAIIDELLRRDEWRHHKITG